MDALKAKIRNMMGWKSPSLEKELDQLEQRIREDERRLFARVLYRVLVDNLHLPTAEIVERIKRNELRCRGDITQEQSTNTYTKEA